MNSGNKRDVGGFDGTVEEMKRRMVADGIPKRPPSFGAPSLDGDGEVLLLRFDSPREGGIKPGVPVSRYFSAVLHVRQNINRTPDVLRRDGAAE